MCWDFLKTQLSKADGVGNDDTFETADPPGADLIRSDLTQKPEKSPKREERMGRVFFKWVLT